MTKRPEDTSAAVPRAQQAEEILSRWRWVEPCAWTIRMLTALEEGVEGGRWFRLFDKVFSERNLLASFQKVARKKGAADVDHMTTRDFEGRLPGAIQELSSMLKDGTYVPQAIRRIVDARTDRFDFLGYTFSGAKHWPRQKSLKNLRDAIRERTRRTTGDSLQCVVARLNPVLRGWYAYFRHSTYRNVFTDVDGYARRRLRSILRKRSNRPGISRGLDYRRWPNRFFAEHGLFSLTAAHAAAVQSSRR